MSIQTRALDYHCQGDSFEAFVAWNDEVSGEAPVVLVAHAFRGREQFECDKAVALAERGYVGVAIDVYGKGVQAKDKEHAFALMNALKDDRDLLEARLRAAKDAAAACEEADASRMAAIGFCFGGLCVLDMARAGMGLAGVISFHGLLDAPSGQSGHIDTRILVEHGWDDPMATPDTVLSFAEEMKAAGADWQLHAHGDTVHSFTNPAADDRAGGTAYDKAADRRSWQSMQAFLSEVLGA